MTDVDKSYNPTKRLLEVSLITGVGAIGVLMGYILPNKIPDISEVKKGFVPPSNIEIKVQDVNLDGKKDETTFIYRDDKTGERTTYFLKFEEDRFSSAVTPTITSKPTIVPFKIEEGR